ncbi:hypothetical protein ACI49Z_003939 [Cronobacter turicensis]|uniref:transcriptional antitermination N peptide n=1 Tax=Cronobacter malonaticus TaxID=413503 RepID=UPI0024AEFF51|nr:hypothetical protein [Cronobacter malonaticus]MDI7595054.1 hypothetical protein [Cronobacter malonaticus]MDI7682349.1 hypothetical protein [Cronobacter sakazakii]
MATIIWKEAKGTAKSRYKARRAAKIEQAQQDASLARRIEQKLSGCVRADRATSLVALRDYQEPDEGGCVCLPDVALYSAGYRKSNNVTAR